MRPCGDLPLLPPGSVRTVSLGGRPYFPSIWSAWCTPFPSFSYDDKAVIGASSAAASPPLLPVPEVWLSPVPESVVPPPAFRRAAVRVPLVPGTRLGGPVGASAVVPSPVSGPVVPPPVRDLVRRRAVCCPCSGVRLVPEPGSVVRPSRVRGSAIRRHRQAVSDRMGLPFSSTVGVSYSGLLGVVGFSAAGPPGASTWPVDEADAAFRSWDGHNVQSLRVNTSV